MFWLGAIASLCYVPGVTGAYIATQWPLFAVVLSFAFWRSGPFTPFHAAGLAFVLYAAVGAWLSPLPDIGVYGLWLVVIMGLCLWFGTTLERTWELYAGLAVGGAVSSLVAVVQYFGGAAWLPTTSNTLAGLYVNSVQQGTVLALVAVALVSERMWLWAVPLVPGLALSQSRGGWLALAVGLLACRVPRLWIFGALAAVGAAFLLSPLSSSDSQRMVIWRAAWDGLTWFGNGTGVFFGLLFQREGLVPFFPEYVHNDGLQLAFEYGIGALLPATIFAYALYRTDAKEWPVVAAFVTASCYSMPLFMPLASFLVFVAVGRILRSYGMDGRGSDHSGQHVVRGWGRAYGNKGTSAQAGAS